MDSLNFASMGVNIKDKGKADEVATPIQICNDMVDLFSNEAFSEHSKFWADLYCKTGNTLNALKKHGVAKENIIAICPTTQSQLFACRQLYGKLLEEIEIDRRKYPEVTGVFSITRRGQVYYISNWKDIVTGKISNTNALAIINKIILKEMRSEMSLEFTSADDFKINNVIMNPPYNKGMDLDFVDLAYKVATDSVVAITPAKWQTTADDYSGCASKNINYKQFREKYVPHMSYVCFYPDALDIFHISQVDGLTYFLIDKDLHNTATVKNISFHQKYYNSVSDRDIKKRQTLINVGQEIVDYLGTYERFNIESIHKSYTFKVITNSQIVLCGAGSDARKSIDAVGKLSNMFNSDGQSTFIGTPKIVTTIPNGAYGCAFSSENSAECESFISWLNCKFTRFFVAINISKLTGILTNDYFRFVPAPPSSKFDHIYTDEELYKAFNLPQKYIDAIEAVIKERK